MSFIVVGTNHKFSPIEARERLSFSKKTLKDALFFLKEKRVFKGAVILSTCNRVEIYINVANLDKGIVEIEDFISRYHEIDKQNFVPYLYIYEGKEAVRHLYKVACGLDSLIFGEREILGQVKFAISEAESVGFGDEFLREIFYSAISFATKMHQETTISEREVSIGSVAIDFIKERIGPLLDKNILIIGVGKVTELVLKYLKKEGPNIVFVSNRTFEKAKELANQIGAKAVRFDELKGFVKTADVVITATASPHFIIKKETLEEIIGHRVLILDLTLPRNVDPRIKELKGIDLFCLEDLGTAMDNDKDKRMQEAKRSSIFLDNEAEEIWQRLTRLEPEPALSL